MKAKSGKRLRAFLCSDVLVLTDEGAKALYRMVRLCPGRASWRLISLPANPASGNDRK